MRLEEERRRAEAKKPAPKKESTVKKELVKVVKTEPPKKKVVASSSLSDLHALRLRLEGAEGALSQHVHICLGDDGVHDCGLRISQLEVKSRSQSRNPRGSSHFGRSDTFWRSVWGLLRPDLILPLVCFGL